MGKLPLVRPPYIFVIAFFFFIFQLVLLVHSFPSMYHIYELYLERMLTLDPFWTQLWFASEVAAEIGFVLRFFGACFFIAFAWHLLKKQECDFFFLKKAVLLEAVHYLFIIPFIVSLFFRINSTIVNMQAGLSYTLQIVLITPAFLMLYLKLRKSHLVNADLFKWGAVSAVCFVFSLWAKQLLFTLYALPVSLDDPLLAVGFFNSALTIFFAGLILTCAFLPVITKSILSFNQRIVGFAFLLVGMSYIIYMVVSLFNQRYMDYLALTELWAFAFVFLGIGYIKKHETP